MNLFTDYCIVFNLVLFAAIMWNKIELFTVDCIRIQLDDWDAEIEAISDSAEKLGDSMTEIQYIDHQKALLDIPNKFRYHDKLVNTWE